MNQEYKTSAGAAFGAALAIIVVWALGAFGGVEVPPAVALAVTTVLSGGITFAVARLTK